jgi:hydrogenase maturation protease
MKNSINFLIIGVGNLLLTDEGLGIHIVKNLKENSSKSFSHTDFIDMGTSSLDICSCINENIKKIVIIDCIKTNEFQPGTVFRLTPEDIRKKRAVSDYSLHQMQLLDSLKIISLLGQLPEVIILSIVPSDINSFSTELSAKIQQKLPDILSKVKKEIINFFDN